MIVQLTDKASCFLPPEGAMDIELHRLPHVNKTYISWHPKGAMINDGIHIDDQWTALGFSDSLSEDQAAKAVEFVAEFKSNTINDKWWLNYTYPQTKDPDGAYCKTAIESLQSLLKSKECYSKNPYGDEEPISERCTCPCHDPESQIMHFMPCCNDGWKRSDDWYKWNRAQERTGRWFIILKQEG